MMFVWIAAMAVHAQDAAEAAPAAAEKVTFLGLILQGGWAMIPLGLLSLAMIFFIVENFISLREKTLLHKEMLPDFQTMGSQGMGKPELLAGNIGEAMITTATGLIVAIPAMLFYFYFKKGFNKTLATLGRNLGFLFDALETREMPLAFEDLSSEVSGDEPFANKEEK